MEPRTAITQCRAVQARGQQQRFALTLATQEGGMCRCNINQHTLATSVHGQSRAAAVVLVYASLGSANSRLQCSDSTGLIFDPTFHAACIQDSPPTTWRAQLSLRAQGARSRSLLNVPACITAAVCIRQSAHDAAATKSKCIYRLHTVQLPPSVGCMHQRLHSVHTGSYASAYGWPGCPPARHTAACQTVPRLLTLRLP